MKKTFHSHWWSAEVPTDWEATEDDQCVTFTSKRLPSAIQVSAAKREQNTVSDNDLEDFARERLGGRISLQRFNTDTLTGFYAEHIEDGVFWCEWWLRGGHIMLYVTYNIPEQFNDIEKSDVEVIVQSLRLSQNA